MVEQLSKPLDSEADQPLFWRDTLSSAQPSEWVWIIQAGVAQWKKIMEFRVFLSP